MTTREFFSPENPTIPACQVRASDIAEDLFVAPTVIEVEDDDTGNVPDEVSEHNSTTKAEKTCSRGFTEAEWNEAYARWKTAVEYDSDADPSYQPKCTSDRPVHENGELSLADALELDFSLPNEVPEYFQNILSKYSHAGKKRRASYSFRQKLALIGWMDFQYSSQETPNWSDASKRTGINRTTLREWYADREVLKKQVDDVKQLGSSKKYGGSGSKKRIRLGKSAFPAIDEQLLNYFDGRANDNLSISRKLLRKQSVRIAQTMGMETFKGSKGYIHRFIKRNAIVPRTITGSGQQVPHDACALALGFIADVGESQLALNIQPGKGGNGQIDETPMWWSMASKRTLRRVGQKIITQKSSGHEKKRFSAVLCGLDNKTKVKPMVIFKGLKNVPKEVRDRSDVCVAVSKGGSMTPDLMQTWIRECWGKRPGANLFRPPSLLGLDIHYSHVDEKVQDVLKKVCNTSCKYVPGGMTGIMAGPDTHWNKVFKGAMREEMDC